MSAPVRVTCPAGDITGHRPGDGTDRFHSIPFCVFDDDFAGARPRAGYEAIDARVPRPEAVALSIIAPEGTRSGADLPVIAFIHGGRFETGSHEDPRNNGAGCARSGAVVVQIGYRTLLPGLARFPGDEPHHYRAVDDCQLALEWIQKNIEAFGGDPTNVTLVGQSAGATIALWLSRRDHYRGAFRRVLACSPAFPRRGWEERKNLLRACLGTPLTRGALLAAGPARLKRGYGRFRTALSLDIALGPHPLQADYLADVDVVMTATDEEFHDMPAARFMDKRGRGHLYARVLARPMGMSGTFGSWLAATRAVDPGRVAARLIGDSFSRRWAQYVVDGAQGRVWLARFTGSPERPALHCAELPALFATDGYDEDFPVHRWFLDFARTGEPGWPRYRAETGRQAVDVSLATGAFTPVNDPLKIARLAFPEAYPATRSASLSR